MRLLLHNSKDNQKGQLALGLVFGFVMVLSMFAFVFNTSMNVREKIKLQQTSDYAALVASKAQQEYLNSIREANLAIESAWFLAFAQQQVPHCSNSLVTSTLGVATPPIQGSYTSYYNVSIIVGGFLAANNISADIPSESEAFEDSNSGGEGVCDQICDQYNAAVNKRIREIYAQKRNYLAGQIKKLIVDGNPTAFSFVVNHFLDPRNLPWGLQQKLKIELTENFTLDHVRQAYTSGMLSIENNNHEWGYDIVDENKEDPLFIPQDEIRPFPIINHLVTDSPQPVTQSLHCVPSGFTGLGRPANSQAKVVKQGDFQSHFFTGIDYMPPANMYEKSPVLTRRHHDPDKYGEEMTGSGSTSVMQLFQRQIGMYVRSAAKPFGGSFPKSILTDVSSMAMSLVSTGNAEAPQEFKEGAGKKFKGSKLFGIADENEIGGYEIYRADMKTEVKDEQGNLQETWTILRKDYLH